MHQKDGSNIRGLAKALLIIGISISVLMATVYTCYTWVSIATILTGISILVCGIFCSLFCYSIVYGIAALVDKTCDIAKNSYHEEVKSEVRLNQENKRIEKLELLRSIDLISEEEYRAIFAQNGTATAQDLIALKREFMLNDITKEEYDTKRQEIMSKL